MAHPCDYQSQSDISRLRKSSQPKTQPTDPYDIALSFMRSNPHWSIDSIVLYLTKTHPNIVTKHHISDAIKTYIFSGN